MKKPSPAVDEIKLWLKGRFALTADEKFSLLLIFAIFWIGLVCRCFFLRGQKPERLPPEAVSCPRAFDPER